MYIIQYNDKDAIHHSISYILNKQCSSPLEIQRLCAVRYKFRNTFIQMQQMLIPKTALNRTFKSNGKQFVITGNILQCVRLGTAKLLSFLFSMPHTFIFIIFTQL